MKKLMYLVFMLIIPGLLIANDGKIHDAAITSISKSYKVITEIGVPLADVYQINAVLYNFSPKDSLKNVKVRWALVSPGRYSNLEDLNWNEINKDYSQQPLSSYTSQLVPNSARDVFNVTEINFDDLPVDIIVCTLKPNGEDDANILNDSLRYRIEKPTGDIGALEILSPTNTVDANRPGGDTVRVLVANYSYSFLSSFKVKWKIDNLSGGQGQGWKEKSFSYSGDDMIPPGSGIPEWLGTFDFKENNEYMITAITESGAYHDAEGGSYFDLGGLKDSRAQNDTAFQYVGTPNSNVHNFNAAGVYAILSPKPGDYKGRREVYAAIKNNGSQPLHAVQVRWVNNSVMQEDLVLQYAQDMQQYYLPQQLVWKIKNWNLTNYVFDTPLDSGEIRQVLIGGQNFGDENVFIAATFKPNGIDSRTAKDTARLFVGDYLLGNYVLGDTNSINQYNSLADFESDLKNINLPSYPNTNYPSDVDPAKIVQRPYGVGPGVNIMIKNGNWTGFTIDGLYPNQSVNNPVSFTGFYDDSTAAVINPSDGSNAPFILDNAQQNVFSKLTLKAPSSGNSLIFRNGSKNNQIKACFLEGANTTSTDKSLAVVLGEDEVDSTQISFSTFDNGSYGAYFVSSGIDTMIVISDCTFISQTNTAITYKNHHYGTVIRNDIYNNRVEFIDCLKPYAGGNRIEIDDDSNIGGGEGYSSKPYSALAFLSSTDTVTTNDNSICVKVDDFNGIHIKDNVNDSYDYSLIVNSSIDTKKYGVLLENTTKLQIANTSINNASGQSDATSGVYIKSDCNSIKLINSAFNSNSGGYAIVIEDKNSIEESSKNNFFSTGGSYGKSNSPSKTFSNIKDWRDYFNFDGDAVSENYDPNFYSDCDLIVCNENILGIGYQQCAKGPAPPLFSPDDNLTGHMRSSMLFEWGFNPDVIGYWMQVSTDPNFARIDEEVKYQGDVTLSSESLIFDEQYLTNSFETINNLQPNTEYYWRVRVFSIRGQRSDWSETRKFTTGNVVPVSVDNDDINIISSDLKIVPNPINSAATLEFTPNRTGLYRLDIVDQLGKSIYSKEINSQELVKMRIPLFQAYDILPENMICFIRISGYNDNFYGKIMKK